MAGGTIMVTSGLALWFGRRFPWMLAVFGGQRIALVIHVVLAAGLLAFIIVHVAQVLRAGLPTLLGMMTGNTANSSAQKRRALAWSAGIVATTIAALTIVNYTSAPTGIPAFLHWAVPPSHSTQREGLAVHRRGD